VTDIIVEGFEVPIFWFLGTLQRHQKNKFDKCLDNAGLCMKLWWEILFSFPP